MTLARRRRAREGQALAELALSLPILLGVFVLVIEGTLMISAKHRLMDAVHQAARAASNTRMSDAEIARRIETLVMNDPLIEPDRCRTTVQYGIDSNGGDNIRVTVTLPVDPVTFSSLGSFTLQSTATYRVPRRDEAQQS